MSYITRFLRGDVKLWQSFWLVFVIPSVLFLTDTVHVFLIPKPIYPYAYSFYSMTIRLATYICFLLIVLALAYGTWKSAKQYVGLQLWKLLAQIFLLINILLILLALLFTSIELYQIDSEVYPYDLKAAIEKLEKR